MWKKTLGIALLALVSFALSGCYAHHRAHYRDGYSPGYVQVRVGRGYGPGVYVRGRTNPRYYRHYRNPGRYYQHRHFRGCGHRW
jgi:hypothetical protein